MGVLSACVSYSFGPIGTRVKPQQLTLALEQYE